VNLDLRTIERRSGIKEVNASEGKPFNPMKFKTKTVGNDILKQIITNEEMKKSGLKH